MVDLRNNPTAPGASELFQLLRDGQPRTRSELADLVGVARSTIALRLELLMDLGLVAPIEDAVSTGGRPSSRFALQTGARVVLGVDVGASHLRVGLTDLAGTALADASRDLLVSDGPVAVLDTVVELGTALLAETGRSAAELLAVGVGLPGPVEHRTGRPINPPIMPGWHGFDVPGYLQESFRVPVLVDNDVNVMSMGERQAAWPHVENLVFVKVATGIGAGIICNGVLLRGADGVAGDIGHIRVPSGEDLLCRCGNHGCLEALAAGPAVAARLRSLGLVAEDGRDVVALVHSGNQEAVQAVRQAGREVGEVLAACLSMLNPEVIVFGGSMALTGEHFIAGVREVVYSRTMPLATQHLRIVQSASGLDAGMLGASQLAIQHALSAESVERMLAGRVGV
ncbi:MULTISPECIES: ROK family transcriptional regulator [unclassified Arthrobacter]|uniref:ROK family transcriptional regulator n=1 Tax=unclassified Arthrobacter TaxID=235627 RepID=UPI0024DF995B|nr:MULTISPECIES: ROK family transcriptional regulator [unclassified Arthrobacter]MCC9145916.1 ROK family transcriptional regulator [Arthrobacter sp. zg-Y919]MDK1277145.1 ROK family transcriptional regulator [Arthrobacter sp. zg.Y919]WIB03663.1 ROK family transcriptional regulator [Arthrobacter sp. zg-Y919]